MSGIDIEVNESGNANAQLIQINKQLVKIFENSVKTTKALGSIEIKGNTELNARIKEMSKNMAEGQKQSEETFKSMDDSLSGVNKTMSGVAKTTSKLFKIMFAIGGLSLFAKQSDDVTVLKNRLRLATDSTAELNSQFQKLYKVSRDTRSELSSVAELYVRFSKSLSSQGASSNQITDTVKTLQQMAALSGTAPEAVRSAFVQLNQGIGSGTIRGEELNSVMEQLPFLGNALMESLDMSAGALREFASEGKLTAEALVGVIEDYSKRTDKLFQETIITAKEGTVQLGGAIRLLTAEIDSVFGATNVLARRLVLAADVLDSVSTSINVFALQMSQAWRKFRKEMEEATSIREMWQWLLSFNGNVQSILYLRKLREGASNVAGAFKNAADGFGEFMDRIKLAMGFDSTPLGDFLDVDFETPTKEIDKALGKVFEGMEKDYLFSFEKTFKDTVSVVTEILRFFAISVSQIANLIVIFPIVLYSVFREASASIKVFFAEIVSTIFRYTRPAIVAMRNFFSIFDISKESAPISRSWGRLFLSNDMDSFFSNLQKLNNVRSKRALRNPWILAENLKVLGRDMASSTRSLGVSLGLLDADLTQFAMFRVRRFENLLATSVKSLADVIRTITISYLLPALVKLKTTLFNIFRGLNRAFVSEVDSGRFFEIGYAIGQFVGEGLANAFLFIGKKFSEGIRNLIKGGFSRAFSDSGLATSLLLFGTNLLRAILQVVGGFALGFLDAMGLGTILRGIGDFGSKLLSAIRKSISKAVEESVSKVGSLKAAFRNLSFDVSFSGKGAVNFMDDMIAGVTGYASGLMSALVPVKEFGNKVTAIFKDMYIAVVGNSYWPDTVDGVVEKAYGLANAEGPVSRFADFVKKAFMSLKKIDIGSVFESLRLSLNNFVANVNIIDPIQKAISTILGTFGALFLLRSEEMVPRMLGAFYFGGLIEMLVPALFASENISKVIGRAMTAFFYKILNGIKTAFDTLVRELPNFLSSLSKGILGDWAGSILSGFFGSLFNNNAVNAIMVGLAAYAILFRSQFSILTNLMLGTMTASGARLSNGILHYFTAFISQFFNLLPILGSSGIVGRFAGSFNKLGVVAMGALALSFLDSVTLVEAAIVSAVLAAFSVFGKAGGARALATVAKGFTLFFVDNLFRPLAASLATRAAAGGYMNRILMAFAVGRGGGGGAPPAVAGAVSKAFSAVALSIKTIMGNIVANRALYGAGSIGFLDMLFGRVFADAEGNVKNIIENSGIGASLKKAMGAVFGPENFRNITLNWRAFTNDVKKFFRGMSSLGLNALDGLIAQFARLNYAGLQPLFGALARLSSWAIAKLAVIGISSEMLRKAFLRLGSFMIKLTSSSKFLQLTLAGILLGFFSSNAAADGFSSTLDKLVESAFSLKGAFAGIAGAIGIGAAITQFNELLSLSKDLAATRMAQPAFLAAQATMRSSLEAGGASTRTVDRAMRSMASREFRMAIMDTFVQAARNVGNAIRTAFFWSVDLIKKVFTGTRSIFEGIVDSVRSLVTSLRGLTLVEAMQSMGEMAGNGTGWLAGIIFGEDGVGGIEIDIATIKESLISMYRGLSRIGQSILPALMAGLARIPFTIAAGLAIFGTGGVLYTVFFGEGNSFFEKLGYVWDRIKGIVGMSATSVAGREYETLGDLPALTLPETDLMPGFNFNPEELLGTFDLSKINKRQYETFKETTKEVFDELAEIESMYFKGELGSADIKDFEKRYARYSKFVATLPQRDDVTREFFVDFNESENLSAANTFLKRIARVMGASEGKEALIKSLEIKVEEVNTVSAVGKLLNIVELSSALWDALYRYPMALINSTWQGFVGVVDGIGRKEAPQFIKDMNDDLKALDASFLEFEGSLTEGQISALNRGKQELAVQINELNRLDSIMVGDTSGFSDDQINSMIDKRDELESSTRGAVAAYRELVKETAADLPLQKFIQGMIKEFNDANKTFSNTLEIDIGADGIDFRGDNKFFERLMDASKDIDELFLSLGKAGSKQARTDILARIDRIRKEAELNLADAQGKSFGTTWIKAAEEALSEGVSDRTLAKLITNPQVKSLLSDRMDLVAAMASAASDEILALTDSIAAIDIDLAEAVDVTGLIEDIKLLENATNFESKIDFEVSMPKDGGAFLDSYESSLRKAFVASERLTQAQIAMSEGNYEDGYTLVNEAISDIAENLDNARGAMLAFNSLAGDVGVLRSLRALGLSIEPAGMLDIDAMRARLAIASTLEGLNRDLKEGAEGIDFGSTVSEVFIRSVDLKMAEAKLTFGDLMDLSEFTDREYTLGEIKSLKGMPFVEKDLAELKSLRTKLEAYQGLSIESKLKFSWDLDDSFGDIAPRVGDVESRIKLLQDNLNLGFDLIRFDGNEGLLDALEIIGIGVEDIVNPLGALDITKVRHLATQMGILNKQYESGEILVEEYIGSLQRLEGNVDRTTAGITRTFNRSMDSINNAFELDLDLESYSGLTASLRSSLLLGATNLNADIQSVMRNGYSTMGESASDFWERLTSQRNKARFLSFFRDLAEDMRDIMSRGLKESFDSLSDVDMGGVQMTFQTFLEADLDKALGVRGDQLQRLVEVAGSSNLPPGMASILNSMDPTSDIMGQLSNAEYQMNLSEYLKTPTEKLTTALYDLGDRLGDAFKLGSVDRPSGGATDTETVNLAAVLAFQRALTASQRERATAAIGGLRSDNEEDPFSVFRNLKGVEGFSDIQEVMANMVTLDLESANRLLLDRASAQLAYDRAVANGTKDQIVLKKALNNAGAAVDDLVGSLVDLGKVAGEQFANSMGSNLKSALRDLNKGQYENFKGFGERLLDDFTNSVIDTAIDGFVGGIMSKFEGTFEKLGEGVFEGGELMSLTMMESIKTVFIEMGGALKDFAKAIGAGGLDILEGSIKHASAIANAFKDIGMDMWAIGRDVIVSAGKFILSGLKMLMGLAMGGAGGVGGGPPVAGGGAGQFATGGIIGGSGTGTSDSMNIWASKGEFIVNAESTKKFLPMIRAINEGTVPKFAEGGMVLPQPSMSTPAYKSTAAGNTSESNSNTYFDLKIIGDVTKETRRTVRAMVPELAGAVMIHNREKNRG